MRTVKRVAATAVAVAAGLCSASGFVQAQDFPNKAVRFVIPYPPGGSTDLLGRFVGQKLSEVWKQPVVAENRPGAGGSIGAAIVAKAAPDGYTLVLGNSASHAAWELLNPSNTPYNSLRDFSPISMLAVSKLVLIVQPSLEVKTVRELVALAKSRPGRLNYGSPSIGSSPHLGMELFKTNAGVDILHIPYSGAAPARTALLAGAFEVYMGTLGGMVDFARQGKIRILAVVSDKRASEAPDIPSMAEAGFPGTEMDTWFGLLAPAGLPPTLVNRINADVRRAIDGEENRLQLVKIEFERATSTPQEFLALMQRERDKYTRLIRDANIKAQ